MWDMMCYSEIYLIYCFSYDLFRKCFLNVLISQIKYLTFYSI